MLIPDQIPKKEPLIKVGIVLPEDDQKNLSIHCTGVCALFVDDQHFEKVTKDIRIECFDRKIKINSSVFSGEAEKIRLEAREESIHYILDPVRAGRSFHWEKHIEVELSHSIEVAIHESALLVTNELPLEYYLACVATSEMSPECPESFLKAQTIVARSWMLANIEQKHRHLGFDVCNDDCCQRFQGTANLSHHTLQQSLSTRGQVLMYKEQICDARYSKSCGGITEKFENLWEGEALDYMQNLFDGPSYQVPDLKDEVQLRDWVQTLPKTYCSPHFIPEKELPKYLGKVDEESHYFRWSKEISQAKLLRNINHYLDLKAKAIVDLEVLNRSGSGRMLRLKVSFLDENNCNKEVIVEKDYNARQILHPEFLYSSACTLEKKKGKTQFPDFLYQGAGWGHGAGLCQIGALGMALAGFRTEEILIHYYPGSQLKNIYS